MGHRRYYNTGAVDRVRELSHKYRRQPKERSVGVTRNRATNGRAAPRVTCQQKAANRKGLYENLIEFLIFVKKSGE
jgi:hypothetical protein